MTSTNSFRPLRRQRLSAGGWAAISILLVVSAAKAAASTVPAAREIALYHTHTGERLSVVYAWGDRYDAAALARINRFLRDFRTGDVADIDPATLDIIHELKRRAGYRGDVHIVSAYRSSATNEMLRRSGSGVARNSQHLEGKAIDLRFPGIETARLRDLARSLKRGGVGYYRDSDFIHVDSGRVRYW